MADVSKLKRRLPTPPPSTEGTPGIERQPESAQTPGPPAAVPDPEPTTHPKEALVLDGRSLRATGRVHQLNVKVTEETKLSIFRLAKERGLLVAEVIEEAVAALKRERR